MVQQSWEEVQGLSTAKAKAKVLETLSDWPLYGSSFFAVIVTVITFHTFYNCLLLVLNIGIHFYRLPQVKAGIQGTSELVLVGVTLLLQQPLKHVKSI